jgi:AcrR family transcriptional regulator
VLIATLCLQSDYSWAYCKSILACGTLPGPGVEFALPKLVDESRIFKVAVDQLMARGYDGATTREIAEAAGVNEVTLFRRYGNKAALFEQAIASRLADTPLSQLVYTGDLEADLLSIVRAYLLANEAHGDIIPIILIEASRHPDLRSSMGVPWRNLQGVVGIIQRYQGRGRLERESPLTAISSLLGPVMISQMLRRANLEPEAPMVDPEAHVEAFLRGRERHPAIRSG